MLPRFAINSFRLIALICNSTLSRCGPQELIALSYDSFINKGICSWLKMPLYSANEMTVAVEL
jgi:hypothetical protein